MATKTSATANKSASTSDKSQVHVREARRDDMDDVLEMIQELAIFEKMPEGPKLTVEDLIRDGGYNSDTAHPLFVCFVAEASRTAGADEKRDGRLLGYTIAFTGYSTWEGRSLQMKDLFVRAEARRLGVGRELFRAIGAHAYRNGCTRLDYHVLNWNTPAMAFYKEQGAVDLTEKEEWLVFRKML